MGSGLRREAPCTSWVSCWVTVAVPARRLDTLSQSTTGSTVKVGYNMQVITQITISPMRHTKIHKILWREDVITVITVCAILHNRGLVSTETACSEQPITVQTASKLVHENRRNP
ncbi:hypothetical protein N1851_011315 [Merluccius polli]|uniref:Uncharacterized protein n=1 Tax=Merluccius polli TaxID=89951 RepID=A0AA47MY62_MERPO|nr:hypothetical protein N1851_011315 [Merluccius polli]